MAKPNADKQINDMLEKHGEEWNDATVWRVQGTAVISHKALERIAAKADISFKPPVILRAERDEAVILVTGAIGDNKGLREEWSIGEALIVQEGVVGGNYKVSGKQASYPYAMAEKRAKDRVILKLIQLSGLLFSEEEADDFKRGSQPAAEPQNGNAPLQIARTDKYVTDGGFERKAGDRLSLEESEDARAILKEGMRFARNAPSVREWLRTNNAAINSLVDADYDTFRTDLEEYKESLPKEQVAA